LISFTGAGPATAIRITHPGRAELLADVEKHLAAGRGFTLATLNLDHIVKLGRDAGFRAAYLAHSHVVADGNPVVWLSRLAGRRVDLIPGSELVLPLAGLAARLDVGLALFGATPATLDRAAEALVAAHPGLRIVARIAPPFGFDPMGNEAAALLADLRQAGAGLCLLALGAPKQEMLAARAAGEVPGCGFVSSGAGLDFIAGSQNRAPLGMRRLALEWAWRRFGNPRRLARRYAACFRVLPGLGLAALRARGRGETGQG
jgi:exopolysaccharide biosynthesis WecB/TagA/CpsF family protein